MDSIKGRDRKMREIRMRKREETKENKLNECVKKSEEGERDEVYGAG